MNRNVIVLVLAVLLNATLLYADSGDLVVSGNVGVGTTSPRYKFEIDDSGTTDGAPLSAFRNVGDGAGGVAIVVGSTPTNGGAGVLKFFPNVTTPGNAYARVSVWGDSSTTGLFVKRGGYVGVNYSNPGNAALAVNGNVAIGTTSAGTGGSAALVFGNGVKPSGLNNAAGLYAKDNGGTTELYAFDESGNEKQISSHALDAPESLYDAEDGIPMIIKEVQYYLGYVRYTNQTRVARLAGMTDAEKSALSPAERTCVIKESFADHESRTGEKLTQLVWEQEQSRIKSEKDAQREAAVKAQAQLASDVAAKKEQLASAGADAKPGLEKEIETLQKRESALNIPQEYAAKPIPRRLQAALGQQ